MFKSVMFDFSGTLFRCETTEQWLRATLKETGHELGEDDFAHCVTRLEEAGALPGGALPRRVPPRLAGVWRDRDLSAEHHMAAYLAWPARHPLPTPEFAERLYDRRRMPAAWWPPTRNSWTLPGGSSGITFLAPRVLPPGKRAQS